MDLDLYFAEQQDRMNLPNETASVYLKRLADFKHKSQGRDASSEVSSILSVAHVAHDLEMGNTTTEARIDHLYDNSEALGKSMKRKKSDPELEAAVKRTKVANYASGQKSGGTPSSSPTSPERHSLDPIQVQMDLQTATPRSTQDNANTAVYELPKAHQDEMRLPLPKLRRSPRRNAQPDDTFNPQSLSLSHPGGSQDPMNTSSQKRADEQDSINSFIIVRAPPPAQEVVQSRERCAKPQRNKRVRSIQPLSSPSPAEHSPIASFSKTMETPPRMRQRGTLLAVTEQHPLDLRPLTEVTLGKRKAERDSFGPPTSPIEDTSIVLSNSVRSERPVKAKPVAAASSKMYLEVKERIAMHTATKQRDKVLKLEPKPIKRGEDTRIVTTVPIDESSVIYVSSSPSSRASSPAHAKAKKAPKQLTLPVEKRKLKGKKEKPQPMTPSDYARMLQSRAGTSSVLEIIPVASSSRPVQKKTSTVKFLEGKNIFYTGGDMKNASETTRGRMDIIVRIGGNLMPQFDRNVTTHIITDANVGATLRALGLKSLKEIPEHIPTVKWSWLLSVFGRESILTKDEIEIKLGDVWLHAAFSERMDAGYRPRKVASLGLLKGKGKERAEDHRKREKTPNQADKNATTAHVSRDPAPGDLARQTGVPLSPPTSPERPLGGDEASSSKVNLHHRNDGELIQDSEDPLSEFYHEAKVEQMKDENGWSSLGEFEGQDSDGSETSEELGPLPPVKRAKRGWTCDKKEVQQAIDCPNQDIIDKLTELMQLHKSKLGDDDHWRAFSYSKCIRALRNYPRRIKNFEEARGIRGVGERTARKIEEILQTGELRRIKYETTKDVEVTRLFQGIYGVGQTIAFQWYSAGCRTLDDLREGKGGVKLTSGQKIGLRCYDDINDRMPREEARAIFDLIKPIALAIDPRLFIEIMGSYRGKSTCGDIDILISRPTDDGSTHGGILPRLLEALHIEGIITEDLAIPDDPHDLEAVYRGLCRLPHVEGSKQRRIDFLSVPWSSRGAALLYYTGDDIFNRAMRLKANVSGYSLNQKGLFSSVVRDPRDRRVKLNDGVLVASETEEEIFRILRVPWQEPNERIRG